MKNLLRNKKSFYVTADDIGVLPTIDLAAQELIEKGIINSISVFVNTNIDISWIKNVLYDIRVGLHLSFSYGTPISPYEEVTSLLSENRKFKSPIKPSYGIKGSIDNSIGDFINHVVSGYSEDELKQECTAQFNKFCSVFGKTPDFINVHHDLDCSKRIMDVLTACYPEFKSRQAALTNDTLGGYIYKFLSSELTFDKAYSEILNNFLQAKLIKERCDLPVEIVFHPAKFCDENLQEFSAYNISRVMEYKVLSDGNLLKQII